VIVEWFADMVFNLVTAVIDILPFPDTLDLGDTSGAFAVMGTFNAIFPVTEALAAAALIVSVQVALLIYRIVKIIFSHVPAIGGSA